MRVVHLVTQDSGGAGRACVRLHKALREMGVDSIILTQQKTTDTTKVLQIAQSKWQKAFARIRPFLSQLPLILYPKREKDVFSPNLPFFVPSNRALLRKIKALKPDIVHLHWVESGFINIKDLIAIKAPLLWSLHDAAPYTGGCHYVAATCVGGGITCKSCPLLQSKHRFDISFWTFKRKQNTYAKLHNLTINGLSRWIAGCAKDSILLGNKPIINLPNPIDTSIYRPINKHFARDLLLRQSQKKLISFGAISGDTLPRKGFNELQSALQSLPQSIKSQCECVVFGISEGKDIADMPTHYLGVLHDDIALALVYSASDVFIMPSLIESFGQTALEALSCGTPVVAFDTSGLKDIITHRHNGYLARAFDIHDLAEGIAWILNLNKQGYSTIAANARQRAIDNFHAKHIAQDYMNAYQKLTGGAINKIALSYLAKTYLSSLYPRLFKHRTYYIGFGAIGGATCERKGFNELQSALQSLPQSIKSQCECVVFGGEAPHIDGIKTHLLGFLNDDASLALAFNACNVFIAPSLAENLSNVIMESLSCGTPVVAFDIGGNADMIQHKVNGYLATDTVDLANGIEWILSLDSTAYANLSRAAVQTVAKCFDAKKVALLYMKHYVKLAGGGGDRRKYTYIALTRPIFIYTYRIDYPNAIQKYALDNANYSLCQYEQVA